MRANKNVISIFPLSGKSKPTHSLTHSLLAFIYNATQLVSGSQLPWKPYSFSLRFFSEQEEEMAGNGGSVKSNPNKSRKRVEASQESVVSSLVRAKDGSAFARWYDQTLILVSVCLVVTFRSCPFSLFVVWFTNGNYRIWGFWLWLSVMRFVISLSRCLFVNLRLWVISCIGMRNEKFLWIYVYFFHFCIISHFFICFCDDFENVIRFWLCWYLTSGTVRC